MNEYFTPQDLAGLPGMPGSEAGVRRRARAEGWDGRRRAGSKAREYHVSQLPDETRAAISTPQRTVNGHAAISSAARIEIIERMLAVACSELQELKNAIGGRDA